MNLPKPNADGLVLVEITGTPETVESIFEALASSGSWTPATQIASATIPFEDETQAQTWAVYMTQAES